MTRGWTQYANIGGKSSVVEYRVYKNARTNAPSSIFIRFNGGKSHTTYKYSVKSLEGRNKLNKLISRAERGKGLNSYIKKNANLQYE